MTKEMFMNLTKEQSWDLFRNLKELVTKFDEINKKLDTLPKLETRVTELEAALVVSQNASALLKTELIKERRSNIQRSQYGRLEHVEISGIPPTVMDGGDLESAVIGVAGKIGVKIKKSDIAACHRLRGERQDTIVRFPNRKFADRLFANASKLKGEDLTEVLGANSPVYINVSLSPELKRMRWVAKRMKSAGHVEKFGTNRRGVYVQQGDGEKHQVFVDSDLDRFLPEGISLQSVLFEGTAVDVGEN